MEDIYHIEGMSDAFVTRYIFYLSSQSLLELKRSDFTSFPDEFREHQLKWCDCVARCIFNTIDDVRQELWRILCRYGQSQGKFPKETVKIRISPQICHFFICKFTREGISSSTVSISKKQRRMHRMIMYQSIMLSE